MSDYVYDDDHCTKRGPGLNHIRDGSIYCPFCGNICYPAKTRKGPHPTAERCQFSTCDTTITIRSWLLPWITFPDGTSLLSDQKLETWLCFEHTQQVRDAKRRPGLKLRRSWEGWTWIDNIDHLRFAVS